MIGTASKPSAVRNAARKGCEIPRIFTPPLRELTPDTSRGFEVIDFAEDFLGVELYPWQKWLLIHALEIHDDGSYRFRRVIVLVARQNGKRMLAAVLAAWWLFIDSNRNPDRLPPVKFRILGTAQNLDTARDVWQNVRIWCDPKVDADEDDDNIVPALQRRVRRVSDTNGKEEIILKKGTRYLIRAASRKSGRGKSAPRVLMDEMREQLDWAAWDSISQTSKAMWSPQLWGFSNAGDSRSVVLNHQRAAALDFLKEWGEYVEAGIISAEEFANGNDVSLGLFEWSAPDGCDLDDVDAILQANPSIGHGEITIASVLADIKGMTESGYRTEVLCQWVTALVDVYLDREAWQLCADPPEINEHGEIVAAGSELPDGAEMVIGIDTSSNRSMTYVGIAGIREGGITHVELVMKRAGMLWTVPQVVKLAKKNGIRFVALQTKGSASADFVTELAKTDLHIIRIEGTALGSSTGTMRDRVRDRLVAHRSQPIVDLAVEGGTTKKLGEVRVWNRDGSPVDIAPLVALSNAVYGVENMPEIEDTVSAYVLHGQEPEPEWW